MRKKPERRHIDIPISDRGRLNNFYVTKENGKYQFYFPTFVDTMKNTTHEFIPQKNQTMWVYGYDELSDKRKHFRLFCNYLEVDNKEDAKAMKSALDQKSRNPKLFVASEKFFTYEDYIIIKIYKDEIECVFYEEGVEPTEKEAIKYIKDAYKHYHFKEDLDKLLELFKIGYTPETLVKVSLNGMNENRSKSVTNYTYGEILDNLHTAYDYFDSTKKTHKSYHEWLEERDRKKDIIFLTEKELKDKNIKKHAIQRALILDNADWIVQLIQEKYMTLPEAYGMLQKEAGGDYDFSHLNIEHLLEFGFEQEIH